MISMRLRAAMAVLAVSATLATVPARAEWLQSRGKKIVVGQPAPPFTLKTFARETVTLADLRGQVVVLNMWATWCAPCKAEMPMMDSYFRANKGRGLRIFGVQTEDSVPPYRLKAVSDVLAYPLTLRFDGGPYEAFRSVPTSYVIDRAGIVRYAKAGTFNATTFHALLHPLLLEAPPADAAPKY